MTGPDTPRRKYNVGVRKIPLWQRTIAHDILPDDGTWAERSYLDIIGSDSDALPGMIKFPYGSEVCYSVELTDDEAEQFSTASNLRYLNEVEEHFPHRALGWPTRLAHIPTQESLAWMRARYVDLRRWHGRDVRVAVLDQGTTKAVRDAMGFTLVARTVTSGVSLGPGQELVNPDHSHGCLTASEAVPAGGLLLDAIISGDSGSSTDAWEAAAIRWAVDNGAKVINLSFGGAPGVPSQTFQDACAYARDNGNIQITISAGNDNLADLGSPSSASRLFSDVHSAIAFDEVTDRRGLFSNHHADGSGCTPGVYVAGLTVFGQPTLTNGTSMAAPHMAQLMARTMTGGTYTPLQVGAAFKQNTRDTGAGSAEQGGGAYDLQRALIALGATAGTGSTVGTSVGTPTHVGTGGGSGVFSAWNIVPASGVTADDMQIAVVASAESNHEGYTPPDDWVELAVAEWYTGYERAQPGSPIVDNMHLRVLAKPYTDDQPNPSTIRFVGNKWTALAAFTLRAPGGIDPERFVPITRFGTGSSITTVPLSPATTSDLQVCIFAQLFQAGSDTATLSLPAGLTQRGFWQRAAGGKGFAMLAATRALTSGARTPTYTSTSSSTNPADLWVATTFTVPAADPPLAAVTQAEPDGPPGGFTPLLPHA